MARLRGWLDKLDELDAKLKGPPLEHRWQRRGGASRFQRWSMRHPVLAPATMFAVALITVIALDGMLLLFGGEGLGWPVLLAITALAAVFLPLQCRML